MTEAPYILGVRSIFEPLPTVDEDRKQVEAVAVATAIIEMLASDKRPIRMTEVARRLNIAPSSCFSILRTLTRENIVKFDSRSKKYAIDLGLVSIARNYLVPGGSLRVAGPLLEKFARHRQITLVIWRRVGHHMMVVDYFDNNAAVRVHIELGARFPLLGGAMGRVMAARGGLTHRELKQLFTRVKWDVPITFDAFIAESEITKRTGWALDRGTFNAGILTISAPVDEGRENVDAVLGATMFVGQHGGQTIQIIAEELCEMSRLLAGVKVARTL